MIIKKFNENDLPGPYVEIAGISWASCNLGAMRPCEYGDYYMWSSTTPNCNCIWENAPFNNGSASYDESYFASVKDTVCPNGVLAPEYDAIYQSTNGVARMPTKEEFQSLYKNTKQEIRYCTYMDDDHVYHSVQGMLFTSKNDDSKKIFFPFSGYRSGEAVGGTGISADLWSSSLHSSAQRIYNLRCNSNGNVYPNENGCRCHGLALRGVKN